MKKRTGFGTIWWIYVLVSVCTERWTIIKEFVKITWNHFQTLHWPARAAEVWDVIHQIRREDLRDFARSKWDDSVATSGEHVFCINKSVLNVNSKKPTWFCIKGCFLLLSQAHAPRCWKSGRDLARLTLRSFLSPAPVFPRYLEARMDLPLKCIRVYTSCCREQPLLSSLRVYLPINPGRHDTGRKN